MGLFNRASPTPIKDQKSVVIHASDRWFDQLEAGDLAFFSKLSDHLAKNGVQTHNLRIGSPASKQARDLSLPFHLIIGGEPEYAPNLMHVYPSPIWGFWHMDEVGPNAHSSLRLSEFNEATVDFERADFFFCGVTGYMLRENVSVQPQEARMHGALQRAKATVFCQNDAPDAYLSYADIIQTAADFDRDALVYIKLAETMPKHAQQQIMQLSQDRQNTRISGASNHDLIEASDVVITQNNSAGFEALMQKCPVITCAKSDYWHATLTAKTKADLHEAIEFGAIAMFDFPYEKYFYWSLNKHGLEPAKDAFGKRAFALIKDKATW